ncbi:MAG: cation-translocating P-type ATPase, partial [Promethearchaeota archaeon]
MNCYSMDIDNIIKEFKTDLERGLTSTEAKIRLKKYGKNELPKVSRGFIRIYLAPLFSWLIVIYLIGALLIYFFSILEGEHDLSDVYTTLTIVAVNMIVAIFQQLRASKKLKALKQLTAPMTTVIRDGEKKKVLSKEIVVGDILFLEQGAKIAADARIITCSNLEVNEASLTGESEPVKKTSDILPNKEISIAEIDNMVFYGTFVTLGTGKAVVVATGGQTEIGKISRGLKEAGMGSIPLQKKMNNFGKWLGLLVAGFWLLVLLFKWILSGYQKIEIVTSLTAAMDIMPINIPLLTTIILITGVLAMAKHGVIIRNLTSVDSLGRISIVCSDKTGTLTESKMVVEYIKAYGLTVRVSGVGYAPYGDFYIVENKPNDNKDYKNKTYKKIKIEPLKFPLVLSMILQTGYMNNNASIAKREIKINSKKKEIWEVIGSPTEGSLITLYKKAFEDIDMSQYSDIIEYPFDSSLKRMSKLFKSKKDGSIFVFSKGASEVIVPLCNHIMDKDVIIPFSDEIKQSILSDVEYYASQGYRVLSLAYKKMDFLPNKNDPKSRDIVESNLTYLGFVTISDPPREGVKESVHQCYNAGVNVIMITGDSAITARAIAKQIDIIKNDDEKVVEGKDIDKIESDEQFNKVKAFARVSPKHKEKIVKRYQSQKRVVAMTGDGVNDALALNLADAGIAMGIQGTDVAKEAADMVISDDSFNSIVTGIREG